MDTKFIESIYKQDIQGFNIDIESYIHDFSELEMSLSGRIDALDYINIFYFESIQLLKNSIILFQQGYFDASFYSLRQSLELSTTMTYLIEYDNDINKENLYNRKNENTFPMDGQMKKKLQELGNQYHEFIEILPDFFEKIRKTKKKLDKLVHKQGFDKFYSYVNHPLITIKKKNIGYRENIKNLFLLSFDNCFSSIMVFRLMIDPMPLLLNDQDIYNRTDIFITEGWSDKLLDKYFTNEIITGIKNTSQYLNHYHAFMQQEEMSITEVNAVKHGFIDEKEINLLLDSEKLSKNLKVCVVLIWLLEDISKIYYTSGWQWVFTNIKSNNISNTFNSNDFDIFKRIDNFLCNIEYNGAYLTMINICGEKYYIEHNNIIDEEMIEKFPNIIESINNNLVEI